MINEIGVCSGCGEEKPIINKKYFLCQKCNYERLHGETYEEKQVRKQKELNKKVKNANQLKGNIPKSKTSKQNKYENELKQVYKEYDLKRLKEDTYYCDGCGKTENLSHSHILGQGWCKSNNLYHLALDHDNIRLHCMVGLDGGEGCHQKWESGDINKMLKLKDFVANLEYIKTVSEEEYQKIINKHERSKQD